VTGQTGGGRPISKHEPDPVLPDTIPDAPAWLGKFAAMRWRELVESLWMIGLLTELDLGTLALYCECWGQYRQAIDDLKKQAKAKANRATHAITLAASTGTQMKNPLVDQINALRKQLQSIGAELGLSASSRTNIDVGKSGNDDPISRKYSLA
jgi:P27 family predicted phage terminase small subunit